MIDDLGQIHQRDKMDVLGAIADEYKQLEFQIVWSQTLSINMPAVANVVYAGMGGSAAAALLAQAIPACSVPFEVVRDYAIPAYVDKSTLFVACSYSGDTEEVIEALGHAIEQGARIAIITTGGELARIAEQKGYPIALMTGMRHGRFTTLYVLKTLVALLERAGVSLLSQADIAVVSESLEEATKAWLPTIPTKLNIAKQIAQECMGRSVVIYAGSRLAPAAYQWKIALNESAKQIAWCGTFPEFNHNEFAGWTGQPEQKPYAIIELRSKLDNPRIQKRFEVTERLLSGMRPSPNVVSIRGETVLEQLLWTTVLADFVGVYLALLNGYDPASLVIVDKLKRAIGEYNGLTV